MAFVKKIEIEQGTIGIWQLNESSEDMTKNFNFSNDEAIQFDKLKLEKRKREFLAVRFLLKILLKNKTELSYGENGNPHLKNSTLNISISHSAELAVIFLSNVNCGIDTENITRNTLKIATRYLNHEELETTQKNNEPALARIIYWGAKEAIYKCALEKEIEFNNHIYLEYFAVNDTGSFGGKLQYGNNNLRFFNLWYTFFGNNVIVYCVEKFE